ncbi:MAG TPA: DUF3047 domain-containing protein [Geobacteraceae bacterium]
MRRLLIVPLLLGTLLSAPANGADLLVGRFSSADLAGWSDKDFKGKTVYTLVTDGDRTVLKAESRHAASGLIKKVSVDPQKLPLLRWTWKVAHSLKKEDVKSKKGDDFAARVYVVFPRGALFWKTRAINYVWANKLAKGTAVPSPYTKNAMIVAVETGDDRAGSWLSEERNVYEDYRQLFGEEPPTVGAVAVMSDTDDTEDEVTAWFGDITLAGK